MNHYGIMTQAVHLASYCLREMEQTTESLQKAQALNAAYAAILRIVHEQFCERHACETCPAQPRCEEAETALYAAREAMESTS